MLFAGVLTKTLNLQQLQHAVCCCEEQTHLGFEVMDSCVAWEGRVLNIYCVAAAAEAIRHQHHDSSCLLIVCWTFVEQLCPTVDQLLTNW